MKATIVTVSCEWNEGLGRGAGTTKQTFEKVLLLAQSLKLFALTSICTGERNTFVNKRTGKLPKIVQLCLDVTDGSLTSSPGTFGTLAIAQSAFVMNKSTFVIVHSTDFSTSRTSKVEQHLCRKVLRVSR